MQDFTNLAYAISAQRKDSTESRIKRDASDFVKIRTKLEACSPFTSDPTLRNIVNGIVAGQGENVPYFESVGNKIIFDIIGKSAFTYKFKRIERARTLTLLGIFQLGRLLLIVPLILPFSSSTNLSLLRQFEIMWRVYQVRMWWTIFPKQIVTYLMVALWSIVYHRKKVTHIVQ